MSLARDVYVKCSCGAIWEPQRTINADGSETYSVNVNHTPPGHELVWTYTRSASGPTSS